MDPTWHSSFALAPHSGLYSHCSPFCFFTQPNAVVSLGITTFTSLLGFTWFTSFNRLIGFTRLTSLIRHPLFPSEKISPDHPMLKRTRRWSSLGSRLLQPSTFPFHKTDIFSIFIPDSLFVISVAVFGEAKMCDKCLPNGKQTRWPVW